MRTILCAIFSFATIFADSLSIQQVTPQQALQTLMEGNERFSSDKSLHPDRTSERRQETATGQSPFAIILGCSDSRVSPEIIFDTGIGDLFIVRVAGNVAGPIELDSIEYSALYLNSSLIVVLGHENCGAVHAVVQGKTKDIEFVADLIAPAAKATEKMKKNRLEATIKANVQLITAQLQQSPVLKGLIEKGTLAVQGGYYNFHTGKVELIK